MAKSKNTVKQTETDAEIEALLAEENLNEEAETVEASEPETAEAEATPAEGKKKQKRVATGGWAPSRVIEEKIGDEIFAVAIISTDDAELSAVKQKNKIKKLIESFDSLPKKVGEKAANVMQHLANGTQLSVYTCDAIRVLMDAKEGSITADDLRNDYLDDNPRPYGAGTASAQSSQMMQLLPALGIADREGKMLTLRDDSVLAPMLYAASRSPATADQAEAA